MGWERLEKDEEEADEDAVLTRGKEHSSGSNRKSGRKGGGRGRWKRKGRRGRRRTE